MAEKKWISGAINRESQAPIIQFGGNTHQVAQRIVQGIHFNCGSQTPINGINRDGFVNSRLNGDKASGSIAFCSRRSARPKDSSKQDEESTRHFKSTDAANDGPRSHWTYAYVSRPMKLKLLGFWTVATLFHGAKETIVLDFLSFLRCYRHRPRRPAEFSA